MTIMEEKDLTSLFASYNPQISSDSEFMSRMRRNLRAVNMVREQTAAMHRKNRLAMAIASVTGFISGVIFTLCYPYIAAFLSSLVKAGTTAALLYNNYGNVAVWSIICCATALLSYSAYDITLLATMKRTKGIRIHI